MPVYTYRREDGTTFDIKQSFADDPLTVCPTTGQDVRRIVQPAGIIFKGSGFYVNDNGKAANSANASNGNGKSESPESSEATSTETKSESKAETKSEAKAETKAS